MKQNYLEKIRTFDIDSLPDLDEIVLGTLEFFCDFDFPTINIKAYKRPLVIGSGNAFRTGKVIFGCTDAVFADEGNYRDSLDQTENIDAVYIISASGGKHASEIAEDISKLNLPLFLITNNHKASAAEYLDDENVLLFPHIREPYTYNTSTYMGMMFATSKESPVEILSFIESKVAQIMSDTFRKNKAFTIILPTKFDILKGFFITKFDELFGPKIVGRAFTVEQIKHAKTVVSSNKELFISFGVKNTFYGNKENRLFIPIPDNCGLVGLMAICYYVIGNIQKQHQPYFKENIVAYTKFASKIFGHLIDPIVE